MLPLDTGDCKFLLVTQQRDPFGVEVHFGENRESFKYTGCALCFWELQLWLESVPVRVVISVTFTWFNTSNFLRFPPSGAQSRTRHEGRTDPWREKKKNRSVCKSAVTSYRNCTLLLIDSCCYIMTTNRIKSLVPTGVMGSWYPPVTCSQCP